MECDASRFNDRGIKLHACIEIETCHVCGLQYCPHWPMCPQCALNFAESDGFKEAWLHRKGEAESR